MTFGFYFFKSEMEGKGGFSYIREEGQGRITS